MKLRKGPLSVPHCAVRKGVLTPEQAMKFSEAITKDMEVLRSKSYNLDGWVYRREKPKKLLRAYGMDKLFNSTVTRVTALRIRSGTAPWSSLTIEITTDKGTFKVKVILNQNTKVAM